MVTQRTHDVIITSLWRQNDVTTSFQRHNDVIIASCVRWVTYCEWLSEAMITCCRNCKSNINIIQVQLKLIWWTDEVGHSSWQGMVTHGARASVLIYWCSGSIEFITTSYGQGSITSLQMARMEMSVHTLGNTMLSCTCTELNMNTYLGRCNPFSGDNPDWLPLLRH